MASHHKSTYKAELRVEVPGLCGWSKQSIEDDGRVDDPAIMSGLDGEVEVSAALSRFLSESVPIGRQDFVVNCVNEWI